jgi:hypothetical protein
MRVTLPPQLLPAAPDRNVVGDISAGIEEVSLYITALVHHLRGMSERNGAKEKVAYGGAL